MSEQTTQSCPTCGAAATPGASYCPTCGSALASTPWAAPGARPASLAPADVNNWAMAAHLTALAGAFIGGVASFVGPLAIWMIRRDDNAFVAQHALEALNFNLMTLAVVFIAGFLSLVTFGLGLIVTIPLLLVFGILWLIWTVQAALAASRGETYRYPVSIRLVS